jgi:hypothetical protein
MTNITDDVTAQAAVAFLLGQLEIELIRAVRETLTTMGIALPQGPEIVLLMLAQGLAFPAALDAARNAHHDAGQPGGNERLWDDLCAVAREHGERIAAQYASSLRPAGPVS